jgi:hypothetical protein
MTEAGKASGTGSGRHSRGWLSGDCGGWKEVPAAGFEDMKRAGAASAAASGRLEADLGEMEVAGKEFLMLASRT